MTLNEPLIVLVDGDYSETVEDFLGPLAEQIQIIMITSPKGASSRSWVKQKFLAKELIMFPWSLQELLITRCVLVSSV